MRFIFENGGRSGVRDVEALGHALESWTLKTGALLVDFAASNDQAGEVIRTVERLQNDLYGGGDPEDSVRHWMGGMREECAQYAEAIWADCESLAIDRSLGQPKSGKRGAAL